MSLLKSVILSVTLVFSGLAMAQDLDPVKDIFFGPIYRCELSNKDYVPSVFSLDVYTQGLFGPSANVQIVYSFPETAFEGLSLVSKLSSEYPEELVYKGYFSNINYPVSVQLDLLNSEMYLTDHDEVFEFTGKCEKMSL